MRLVVEIMSGSDRGSSVALKPGDVRKVGRADDADLRIRDDPLVSRLHFSVEWTGTECRVRDLDSRNGTTVNGAIVKEAKIADGGQIAAGKTQLRVRIIDDDVAPRKQIIRSTRDAATEPGRTKVAPEMRPNVEPDTRPPDDKPLVRAGQPAAKDVEPLDLIARGLRHPYRDALGDAEAEVRGAALYAAAWAKQSWVIDYCLAKAKSPAPDDWEPLYLLAVLGRPDHLTEILALTKKKQLGARRFSLIGTFGYAGGVPALLEAIAGDDPLAAAAAGAAFEKITGIEIPRRDAEAPPASDASDNVEEGTAESVALPDPEAARSIWKEQGKNFEPDTRWCRGVDVTTGVSKEALSRLDLESRFEASLRARFEGRRSEGVAALRSFPQYRTLPPRS